MAAAAAAAGERSRLPCCAACLRRMLRPTCPRVRAAGMIAMAAGAAAGTTAGAAPTSRPRPTLAAATRDTAVATRDTRTARSRTLRRRLRCSTRRAGHTTPPRHRQATACRRRSSTRTGTGACGDGALACRAGLGCVDVALQEAWPSCADLPCTALAALSPAGAAPMAQTATTATPARGLTTARRSADLQTRGPRCTGARSPQLCRSTLLAAATLPAYLSMQRPAVQPPCQPPSAPHM
jgi:hypothetical protein